MDCRKDTARTFQTCSAKLLELQKPALVVARQKACRVRLGFFFLILEVRRVSGPVFVSQRPGLGVGCQVSQDSTLVELYHFWGLVLLFRGKISWIPARLRGFLTFPGVRGDIRPSVGLRGLENPGARQATKRAPPPHKEGKMSPVQDQPVARKEYL